MSDYTTLAIRQDVRPVFEEGKAAVAAELGDEPTNDETIRELVEAYRGGDACGAWRGESHE
jgi:hypothetical protein